MNATLTDNRMQCMEVWGGNQAVDAGVVMAGLDAWVYCAPYQGHAGGGDVYYVSSCATGRITRLLVADVSGHGSAVAEAGAGLRLLMRRYVNHIDQRRFVRGLNRASTALSSEGGFATAVVATFFAPTRRLTLCNAGHPPPLLYRARAARWSFIEAREDARPGASNVPFGIDSVTIYDETTLVLGVNDLVLCYTDSLIEARNAAGRMLGTAGLLDLVDGLDAGDPTRMIPALLDAVRSGARCDLGDDDLTILLFRPNGLAPRVPLRDRILAPFRIAGALARSLRPGRGPMPWPELSLRSLGGAMFHPFNHLGDRGRKERTAPPPRHDVR